MTFDNFSGLANQTSANGNTAYIYALFCQASLETGNFTSNIFKTCKNMFGMRPSKVRQKFYDSVYNSSTGEYAVYSTALYSLIDRVDLDSYNGVIPPQNLNDVQRYFQDVKNKGYATDPDYVAKLMHVFQNVAAGMNTIPPNQALSGDNSGDVLDYEDDESPSVFNYKTLLIVGAIVLLAIFTRKYWTKHLPF